MTFDLNQYPISCAADRPLFESAGTPQMRETVMGYFRPLTLTRVKTRIVNSQIVEDLFPLMTRGATQPLSTRRLELKPEGQRAWEWILLHCTTDLVLNDGDVVLVPQFKGPRKFRVMGSKDYSQEGFIEYELCNDYPNRT